MREYRNLSKIVFLIVLLTAFALEVLAQPQYGATPRRKLSREERRQLLEREASTAVKEIEDEYENLTDRLNSGQILSGPDLKKAFRTVAKNKKYLPVLDDSQKTMYHTLAAWVYHFDSKQDKALKDVDSAWKIASQNPDVVKTHFALSLIYTDYTSAIETLIKQNTDAQAEETESQSYQQESEGNIQLDINSVQIELLGKVFDFKPEPVIADAASWQPAGQLSCILLWAIDPNELDKFATVEPNDPNDPNIPAPVPQTNYWQQSKIKKQIPELEAFSKLQSQFTENQTIAFAGFNLNDAAKRENLENWLGENPQNWQAFILPAEQQQKMFSLCSGAFDKPTLLIVAPDSTTRYAGKVESFLPQLIIRTILENPQEFAPADSNQTPAKPQIPPADRPVESPSAEPNKPEPQPKHKTIVEDTNKQVSEQSQKTPPAAATRAATGNQPDEDFFDPQAETLLEHARTFFKISKKLQYTTYQKPIDICRRVMKDYPNTKYVQQAQILLRQVPERLRQKYNLTDEELGL